MRCTKSYAREDSKKPETKDPQCANYGANHSAIYRGCNTYKVALKQQKEMNELRNRNQSNRQRQLRNQLTDPAAKLKPLVQSSLPGSNAIRTTELPSTKLTNVYAPTSTLNTTVEYAAPEVRIATPYSKLQPPSKPAALFRHKSNINLR